MDVLDFLFGPCIHTESMYILSSKQEMRNRHTMQLHELKQSVLRNNLAISIQNGIKWTMSFCFQHEHVRGLKKKKKKRNRRSEKVGRSKKWKCNMNTNTLNRFSFNFFSCVPWLHVWWRDSTCRTTCRTRRIGAVSLRGVGYGYVSAGWSAWTKRRCKWRTWRCAGACVRRACGRLGDF